MCLRALLVLASVMPMTAFAQFRVSPLLSDGMVVQRGQPIALVGHAPPGSVVSARLHGDEATAQTAASGLWTIHLPARDAGGPYELMLSHARDTVIVRDVYVGDVWVASGQSNMEWTVQDAQDAEREMASAQDPLIRHFKVPRGWADDPQDHLAGGMWEVASPETVGHFSAVAFYFARTLRPELGVPIGIINTTWGGSRIEPWMHAEALGQTDAQREAFRAQERATEQRLLDNLRTRIGGLPDRDEGLIDGIAHWAHPELEDTSWALIAVPSPWEAAGYEALDGIAWYRRAFTLTPEQAAQGITLGLGKIDDSDISYVNGHEVGQMTNAWTRARVYPVPPAALRAGRNVIAVRVEDTGGGGGMAGEADEMFIAFADGSRASLAGDWRFRVSQVSVSFDGTKNQVPTLLYNAMVHPLRHFPVRGFLWYQGESNAYFGGAEAYREQFSTMITDWRRRWGLGELPFLFVQLAAFHPAQDEPSESAWAVLRESQAAALALPNTGQAIAIDLGDAEDIHPRNKQDVGRRLALSAQYVAYGHPVVHSGPTLRSFDVEGHRVRLAFDYVGSGLHIRGSAPEGFALAGADGRFVWAQARVEGNDIVLWNDAIPQPVFVRYAWADNPARANVFNREGLPLAPFRTSR